MRTKRRAGKANRCAALPRAFETRLQGPRREDPLLAGRTRLPVRGGEASASYLSFAEHLAVVPPLAPAQDHAQRPLLLETAEALPLLQRWVVGFLLDAAPLDEPQAPLISSNAEHCAEEPPFEPVHVHEKGPDPVTAEAEPELHRLAAGAVVTTAPFASPQAPLNSS